MRSRQTGDGQAGAGSVDAGWGRVRRAGWAWMAAGVAAALTGGALRGATLTAALDRSMVPLGESVTLSLIFEGGAPPGSPRLPELVGVRVQPGVSQRSEFTFVNGRQSSRQIFDYVLVPLRLGEVVVPGLQIQVGQEVLRSQPLVLKVVEGTARNAVTNLAFLRLVATRKQVYVGEPFRVEMQLYVRLQGATDVNRPQLAAEGFSFGQIQQGPQSRTQVEGGVFDVVTFQLAATPVKAGMLKLGPATCDLTLLIPSGAPQRRLDPFGDPFGLFGGRNLRRHPTTIASEILPVEVLPLPGTQVPPTFNGAVGRFQLNVTASPTEVAVGDPITVRVQISGTGPIEALNLPTQPAWKEFKTYPPSSEFAAGDPLHLSGTKTFTQVLIPQNHEIKTLPPFTFSYFDSQARQYRTLSGPAIALTVKAETSPAAPPPLLASNPAPHVPVPVDDVLPVQTRLEGAAMPEPFLASQPWFLGVQSLPVLAWLSIWLWRKRADRLAHNPRLRRQREVAREVRAGLASLRAQAAAGQPAGFFATLFHLLQQQIGERLDTASSAITEAVIEERLTGAGLPEAVLADLHELFQSCNLARYAPTQSTQELVALVPRVESTLRALQTWTP
ncbi:MAG: protein BatD [Verrucomicrobia bacterium]|nr:protein BatD [Verrucomicrobiota bacterium]